MVRKTNAPAGCDPARGCGCMKPCLVCECNFTTTTPTTQPRPGTALCAYLRRFLGELDAWHEHHGDRQTQGIVDCCTVLLNERKGGRHGA